MATDPGKTPLEVIYGGIAAAATALAWYFGRRKKRREFLQLEPVAQMDFEEYKKQMEAKFAQIDAVRVADRSAILDSITVLSDKVIVISARQEERHEQLQRMENRLDDILAKVRE